MRLEERFDDGTCLALTATFFSYYQPRNDDYKLFTAWLPVKSASTRLLL